jgi:hypothetical protein
LGDAGLLSVAPKAGEADEVMVGEVGDAEIGARQGFGPLVVLLDLDELLLARFWIKVSGLIG